MKYISIEEYEAKTSGLVFDVVASGEAVRVDTGEAGAFVMIREDKFLELFGGGEVAGAFNRS
jgi:hypothetical protein